MCKSPIAIQGKQGEIKHVYRGSVFIQSRNLVENGGLIVAKARHVELAGGTGAVSSSSCVSVCLHAQTDRWIYSTVKCVMFIANVTGPGKTSTMLFYC